jgi:hypothetical protein
MAFQSESQILMARLHEYREKQRRAGWWAFWIAAAVVLTFIANIALGG